MRVHLPASLSSTFGVSLNQYFPVEINSTQTNWKSYKRDEGKDRKTNIRPQIASESWRMCNKQRVRISAPRDLPAFRSDDRKRSSSFTV